MELENEAEFAVAKFGQRPFIHHEQVLVFEIDLARRRPFEASQQVKKSGFAYARLSDDRYLFTGADLEIEAVEHHDLAPGIVELLVHVARAQQGRLGSRNDGRRLECAVTHSGAPRPATANGPAAPGKALQTGTE